MKKDDLRKLLEDDFFGEGDGLGDLDDISLDISKPVIKKEKDEFDNVGVIANQKESKTDNELLDNENKNNIEDKDIFDLDGFDFDDEEDLLDSDLDLESLDKELSLDIEEEAPSVKDSKILENQDVFNDVSKDVDEILSQPEEKIEEDNNTFTNYVHNDTINKEDNYRNTEENEGLDMDRTSLNYNDFSDAMKQDYINVKKLDFPELNDQLTGSKFKVDVFSNIPVNIDVYLGKTTLSLKDVHDLSKGSVIELDNYYGEPLELKINGELIATGEVVAIDNKYGIMIKDIVKS